ncbi:MAG: F0F1 ATP synthase subunit A [Oscillospiraceae bacterium]|nr:F0F1 ATP synthase subunit A [Oscillospiraceae bacterium]
MHTQIEITGAKILLELPFGLTITETQVNMWIVMALITGVCIWLTHDLKVKPTSKRQIIAEYLVNLVTNFVEGNMGKKFKSYTPFVAALFSLAMCCSLISLLGMYSPTSDLNTTIGWALIVFFIITYYKIKTNGPLGYAKSLTEPIFIMTPMNIIGEFSTPISMAFRLFGNVASGSVISALVYAALAWLNGVIFGWLPGFLGEWADLFPILQLGLPAVLSLYFDIFSSVLQAFIFCMLTMLYIASAAQTEEA